MNERETRVYKETKLRNLKRQYDKVIQHADLIDMASELKTEIIQLEDELGFEHELS